MSHSIQSVRLFNIYIFLYLIFNFLKFNSNILILINVLISLFYQNDIILQINKFNLILLNFVWSK